MRMSHKVAWTLSVWLVAGCLKSTDGSAHESDAAIQDAAMHDAVMRDSGAPWMQVLGALVPDEACVFDARQSTFLLKGSYDMSDLQECRNSYVATFAVESHVPAAELPDGFVGIAHEATRITEAIVTLLDENDATIATTSVPNPFRVTTLGVIPPMRDDQPTAGIVEVELVPTFFRAALDTFVQANATIVAEIALAAHTGSGEPVAIDPFRFPIQLCTGCLSHCASTLTSEEIDALQQGQCPDNAAADGRACIDQGC